LKNINNKKPFWEPYIYQDTHNKLKALNNSGSFVGLSETANTSKKARSFAEWIEYKKGKVKVDPNFRERMISISKDIQVKLQDQIKRLLAEQNSTGKP